MLSHTVNVHKHSFGGLGALYNLSKYTYSLGWAKEGEETYKEGGRIE
jgi:hypothetical protein